MKMKLMSLVLALAMLFTLTACGSKEEEKAPVEDEKIEEVAPEAPEQDAEVEEPAEKPEEQEPAEKPEEEKPAEKPEVKPEENTPSQPPVEEKPEEQAPAAPQSAPDLNAFYESVAASYGENWPFMMMAEGELLDGFYEGLSAVATKQCYAYMPAMSAVAAEVVLVEVENAADVETVKTILQTRIDNQVDGGAWYPETIENWKNNSRLVVNGNCIMMVVYDAADSIVASFNGLFA